MKKRLVSLLLACLFVFACCPVWALADVGEPGGSSDKSFEYDGYYVQEDLVFHLDFYGKEASDGDASLLLTDEGGSTVEILDEGNGAYDRYPWNSAFVGKDGGDYDYSRYGTFYAEYGENCLRLSPRAYLQLSASSLLDFTKSYTVEVVYSIEDDGITKYDFSDSNTAWVNYRKADFSSASHGSNGGYFAAHRRHLFDFGRMVYDMELTDATGTNQMSKGTLYRWSGFVGNGKYKEGDAAVIADPSLLGTYKPNTIRTTYPAYSSDNLGIADAFGEVVGFSTVVGINHGTCSFTPNNGAPDTADGLLSIYAYANAAESFRVENQGYVDSFHPTLTFGRNTAMNIYSIRIYAKELSSREIAQNHFADIARHFQLDLTDFEAADYRKQMKTASAMAGVDFEDDRDGVVRQLANALYVDPYLAYDGLYVTDGIVSWYDAYGKRAENSVEIAGSTVLTDKVGATLNFAKGATYANSKSRNSELATADYPNGVPLWQTGEYAYQAEVGLSYGTGCLKLTGATKLTLTNLLPQNADFTFEMISAYEDDGITAFNFSDSDLVAMTAGTKYKTVAGMMAGIRRRYADFGSFWVELENTSVQNSDTIDRSMLANQLFRWRNSGGSDYLKQENAVLHAPFGVPMEVTMLADYSANADALSLSLGVYRDGVKMGGGDYAGGINSYTKPQTVNIADGTAMDIYALRIYNRLLTEGERHQNHLADLAKYYLIDGLDALMEMSTEKLQFVASAVTGLRIGNTTKEAVESAISAAAAEYDLTSANVYVSFNGIAVYAGNNAAADNAKGAAKITATLNAVKIAELEAQGYTVNIGIIGASNNAGSVSFVVGYGGRKQLDAATGNLNGSAVLYTTGMQVPAAISAEFKFATQDDLTSRNVYTVFMVLTKVGESDRISYMNFNGAQFGTKFSGLDLYRRAAECGYHDNAFVQGILAGAE